MDAFKQAEHTLNVQDVKDSALMMKDFAPEIAKIASTLYNEMKDKGFSGSQAFSFTKDYMMNMLFSQK